MSVWRASDTSDRERQPAARSIHSMSHWRSASAPSLSASASDGTLHRRGFRPRVPPWPLHAGGRSFLQESRVRFAYASQRVPPCPRGAESLSQRRDRGVCHRPFESHLSGGTSRDSWNNRPQAACHATLGLQSSPASTYPAARRGSNGAQRGWRIPDVELANGGLSRCLTPHGGGGYDRSGSAKGVENGFQAAQILVFAHTQGFSGFFG